MSRDIKFRAWNSRAKEMCTPFLWVNEHNIPCNQHTWTPDAPLMQFTGMFDKNGNEIYEGDLVRFEEGRRMDVAEVRYSDIYGYWFANNCEYERFQNCEVVGNIHQNPELLEDCK